MLGVMCASHNWMALRLDGSCSVKQRQALVDTFNDPKASAIACSCVCVCRVWHSKAPQHTAPLVDAHNLRVCGDTGLFVPVFVYHWCRAAPLVRAAAVIQGWWCGPEHHWSQPPGAV